MTTSSTQFFSTGSSQQAQPQQQRGLMRKAWDGTKWAVGGALWGITRPVAWAFNPIGDGLGSGLVSGAKKELEQMVRPDGPLVSQLQESVEQALLKQPPQELFQLKELIKKALENTHHLTFHDVRLIDAHFKLLFNEQSKLLKLLAPDLSQDGVRLFQKIATLFKDATENELLDDEFRNLDLLKQRIADVSKQDLQNFDAVFNTILDRNQGALIQAMSFLQQALLSDEQGILAKAIEVLKSKATDEQTGLIKKVVDQLTQLLDKKDGPLDLLTNRLTVGEGSIIAQAVTLLKAKLLEKEGIVDEIGKRFNDEQEGIIVKALAIAKRNIDDTLKDGLALLKTELTSETGLMATLKQQVSGNENSVLKQAIGLLNESLYHPNDGIVSKLRRELTSEEKGMLVEALKIFAKALNDEKEGILAKGIALLKQKLNDKDGVLDEALRLLEHKLNGKDGIVANLQHRLINEHDGALINALNLLQAKLNDEKTGILATTLSLLEKRLLSENGIIDSLEKKLTAEETGILTKAVESMKKALEKKDGPLDLIDQRVQKVLSDSLELLQKKCLDEQDGLLAQTLELAHKKLNAENGLLDTLSRRLNDPKDGIIAKTIETLNNKLLEENGPFDLLQKKLLDEKDGLLAKAIDLLNFKLQQSGGPLDTLQKKLVDKDGVLDQALNMLQDRLTNADRGILVQVKKYLSDALSDQKEGILVQAIDLLNRKLHEKGGPIDLLDMRLTDKDTGILSRAAGILQEKLMAQGGLVDQLDEKLTGQAHPLLSNSRKKLIELRRAVINQDQVNIQKFSRELQQLLEQLTTEAALVFNKNPLLNEDRLLLNQLKTQLPHFYSNTPPTQGSMLAAVEAALSAINRYYGSYEGIAARTATILQDTISDAIEPLLTRVENMPKKMVDNLLGRTPQDASNAASGGAVSQNAASGGTVSQFLGMGGSILKNMLDKGVQAVSKQALASFTNILAFGIQQALNKMKDVPVEDAPAFRQSRMTLTGIMGALNSARENGNWSVLYENLVDASEALKSVKIYINGFQVPNIGSGQEVRNAEGTYSDNMNALQEAMNNSPVEPENQDWKTLAKVEKDKLVENTTKFLTIKHIYEDICRLTPSDERFYMRLLMKSKEKGAGANAELEKLFFEELEKNKVSLVKRLWARTQYFFYGSIIKRYITKASTIYFDEIFNYIERHKVENFDTLRNQVTTNFTRYLTILGGAYQNVAKNPNPTGTLNEMLQKELEKRESNLGFETKELYLEFAQIVLQKTLGSGLLGWLGKKFISNPEEIVRSIIDKSLGSMQDARGYTHALNSVIREQLEEIWKLLQADYARQQNHPTMETPELSNVKKNELAGLVKNLFEVLAKSKCQTKDELRDLIKGKLLSAKVNQAIDDLFIEEIIAKVTNILALSVQSLVKEDQLQKLAYKFANLVNRTFEIGEEVTLQEMQEEERKIAKLSGQILRLAVNTAVEEKFDFTGKKQQKETNRFIGDLHNRSTQFFTTMCQDLSTLATMDFSSLEGKNKINKITEETLAYESECYESSFQAKSSKVNSNNKDEIGERYFGIAQQSQPLVQTVARLKQHSKTLENIQIVVPHLNQIKTIASAIPLRLFHQRGLTNEDLSFCENQLAILDTHLEELKKMRNHAALAEQIAAQTRTFATIMIDLRKVAKTNSFCVAQSQPGSLLEQIANEKKQSLGPIAENASLKNKLTMFKQEVLNAFDDVYSSQLFIKLRNIEEATLTQQIDTAYQEFIGICRQAMAQANLSIETHRGNYYLAYQSAIQAINETHLLDPGQDETANRGIRESITLAQQHLQTLATWEQQHIKLVPYINFPIVDMKGLQDWASGLVYERVYERLDGFMSFLKREENYRYGLLNHLFLVPYVQVAQQNIKK
jgi:hypothetical protein